MTQGKRYYDTDNVKGIWPCKGMCNYATDKLKGPGHAGNW